MTQNARENQLFGEIAVGKKMITKEKLERALVIQRAIFNRAKVHTPIGAVLIKMDLLTQEQVEEVLKAQMGDGGVAGDCGANDPPSLPVSVDDMLCALELKVSADKLSVYLEPFEENQSPPSIDALKRLLKENDIVHGVVEDKLIQAYLNKNPLPMTPFLVAKGNPPVQGRPPDIKYHFDTDPMRIGTLLDDGTMDWKNRGEIPQVATGMLLAEKVGGTPGKSGIDVHGQEVAPPRIKDPPLKFSKGAERSEDGRQILAKINGTPKLAPDGRVGVFAVLPVETDIGIETGHIEFDGHIDVNGGVTSGYQVKGRSISAKEIQNAQIEIEENVVSYGGIYGSELKVGGNLKASHIHNSTGDIAGDLLVDKEVFGCTLEVNGRCLIDGGKIIASRICAKKGIQVKDVGTLAARPSELIVGVDFKFERDMAALKAQAADFEKEKAEAEGTLEQLREKINVLDTELGQVAQEQDACMVRKRQLEEKKNSPAIAQNPEKRNRMEYLIRELSERYDALDEKVHRIMALDDEIRFQINQFTKRLETLAGQIAETQSEMDILQEAAAIDTGLPVVKVNGTIFSKTTVSGPHQKIVIPQEMQRIRIAESQTEAKHYEIKISSLR